MTGVLIEQIELTAALLQFILLRTLGPSRFCGLFAGFIVIANSLDEWPALSFFSVGKGMSYFVISDLVKL